MSEMSFTGSPVAKASGAVRIQNAFAGGNTFIAFLTGGDPSLEQSYEFVRALIDGGADIIEIGIPFSDPIAEGPVIQEASLRALEAGATLDSLFDLVRRLRRDSSAMNTESSVLLENSAHASDAYHQTPLLFMGYLNPIFHYGYERFFSTCSEAGVDGVIIADLPFDERSEVLEYSSAYGIAVISLIAPTSAARIQTIAREAEGFIYLVSSLGVTGQRAEITTDLDSMVTLIREVTDLPIAVGFGIHTPEQAQAISRQADGVIVGSAIVGLIAQSPSQAPVALYNYAKEMKLAMTRNA